jgi:Tol biopolymer transport system component
MTFKRWSVVLGLALALASLPRMADAQYFGRNKVQYRTFDFQVLKTEHFDLYYYPEEAEAAAIVGRMAERWNDRLTRFFGHELRGRQPLILYAVGAHFRQTNAIEGLIGEGTGGVTEALKRRVVLPMSGSLADTDHVLGHELVHAFQFDMTGADPRDHEFQAPGILAFPLWYVEGMAEYLSLGPVDGQTAMWLRDAAIREKLPHVKDLDHPRYFPYRWGHAFWAYIGAKYGDRSVASLIRSAANPRFDLVGLTRQLGTDPDTLTNEWHAAIRAITQPVADELPAVVSRLRRVIGPETGGGRFNVGPEISPDGRHIAFFSERDRFAVELFLADAETGEITRKLLRTSTDPHFDSLEFVHSAGAWSPDGRTLVVSALRGGRPMLALIDPQSGRVRRELELDGLDDALNPSFAPDGQSIVLSGNAGGLFDIYRYTLASAVLERLTHDPFADLEPTFTPDGQTVVFSTERYTTSLETLEPGPMRLASIDLATKTVRPIAGFLRGKHVSPRVTPDGASVVFVGDPDGVSNIYRVPIGGGPIEQLSTVPTGIAGITSTSPALSSASVTGRLAFSVFEDDGHTIYTLDPADIVALVPSPASSQAAVLPGRTIPAGDVQRLLADAARGLPATVAQESAEPYRRTLMLDEIGQPTIQGTVYEGGGTYMQGGMSAFFSDMLGDRALGLGVQFGGTMADIGAELLYVSRRHRWNWATSVGISPYSIGYLSRTDTPDEITVREVIQRQICTCAMGATTFAFNTSTRLELSGAGQKLSFVSDVRTSVFDPATRQRLSVDVERVEDAAPLYLGVGSVALVKDTTYSGATAPLMGTRSRFEVGFSRGSLQYQTLLLDWRRYFMPVGPVTIAVRGMHYGRYGRNSDSERLIGLYAGYPEFVHGYGVGSFSPSECPAAGGRPECAIFDRLIGSRMAIANIEVRAPLRSLFTGQLEYGRIPIDVAGFFDMGVAWTEAETPAIVGGTRGVVRSIGGAVRVNVFGLLPIEVSAAHPFDRVDKRVQWQIGIRQGF